MNYNMETKHIIAGFTQDFDIIKNAYVSVSPNLKLEDFFSHWKNARLDFLFANRYDPRELLESIVEMNKRLLIIVTDDLVSIESRTIALYMLFCIAVKQPKRMIRKIRLTCDDAICVNKLCEEIRQSKDHSNAFFCWNYLRSEDCIDFVEERVVYGPSLLRNRGNRNRDEIRNIDPYLSVKSDTREFVYNKLEPSINQIESLCTQYTQMRDILQLEGVTDATVDLDSRGTLIDYLEQAKSLMDDFKTSENL